MSALQLGGRSKLLSEPLDCRLPATTVARCLDHTERPFALIGAWAGGGAVLGCSPIRVARDDANPFALIGETPREHGHDGGVGGGWVGYLGYPLRSLLEDGHPSPPRAEAVAPFVLAYYDHVVRRDAGGRWWFEALWTPEREVELERRHHWWRERLADPPPEGTVRTGRWRLEPTAAGHAALVDACRRRIHAGDLFQANICAQLEGQIEGSPLELFIRGLESIRPDRASYLEGPWGAIVSFSPELFLERRGRRVRTAPIKGTRPRPEEERAAAAERAALASSPKDRAENVMIVDLMRNDLGRVCEPGTISVDSLATAHAHAGVWHLVSEVQGLLRPEVDDGALLRATFPPGSVTGAPKIAAMNVIAELESTARQAYTGAIGIASPYAGLELSVAIRTFEITGTSIRLGVGGGVVADSDPEAEARELAVKAAPLFDALGAKLPARRQPGRTPPVRRLGPVPVPRPDRRGGVFETMLVEDRRAPRVELHLARLRASVASLYGAELSASLAPEIAEAAQRVPGAGRLRVSLHPTFARAPRAEHRSGRVAVAGLESSIDVSSLVPSAGVRMRAWTVPGGLGRHKWADRRLLEAIEASGPGEAPLLVDADGFLLEASRANVFVLGPDGILRTPPDDGRILPGIARSLVLSRAPALGLDVSAARLVLDDLIHARGVVLTSALRCVPVLELDRCALHTDADLLALVQSAVTG